MRRGHCSGQYRVRTRKAERWDVIWRAPLERCRFVVRVDEHAADGGTFEERHHVFNLVAILVRDATLCAILHCQHALGRTTSPVSSEPCSAAMLAGFAVRNTLPSVARQLAQSVGASQTVVGYPLAWGHDPSTCSRRSGADPVPAIARRAG